jgi:integrase
MPRKSKGPHLWFRKSRFDKETGKLIAAGQWYIIDAGKHVATGCAEGEEAAADRQLTEYKLDQYRPVRRARDIEDIPIAEVLAIYDADCRDRQANKRTYDTRILRLNEWWGSKMLAEVNGQTCRDYTAWRGNTGGARRDLEDLRAAIGHHSKEGLHRGEVRVWMPEKGEARDRFLTRSEAARLIWACWRYRVAQKRHRGPDKGKVLPTRKQPLKHVARFILLGLYTGTRAGAIAAASPYPAEGRAWVDLDAGIFYRLAKGKRATNKRATPVRLPANLLGHLRRWKRTAITTGHFIEHNGQPVESVNKGFAHGVQLAGLEGEIVPHTLRHTAATWLMQNGADLPGAANLLGMSIQTLERVYWHHHPDFQRAAVEAFRPRRPSNEMPTKRRGESGTKANTLASVETPNA